MLKYDIQQTFDLKLDRQSWNEWVDEMQMVFHCIR